MNAKRGISLLVIVTSIALFAGACGSDSKPEAKKSDKTSSSTTEKQGDDAPATSEETTTTLGNDDFAAAIDKINTAVADAGTEPCALLESLSTQPPLPANETQTKQMVDTYSRLLKAIGAAVAATSPDSTKVLDEASASVKALGETKKFAPNLFESKEFAGLMSSEKVAAALAKFTEISTKCVQAPAAPEG